MLKLRRTILYHCRPDVPVPDHQRGAGHVPQHPVPGAHHEAGGGGGLAHHADHLLVPGRAPGPVLLRAAHRRPAGLRLRRRRLHALHEPDHLHHGGPALRQLRRQGAGSPPRWPHHPDRLVAQPGPLGPVEPDGQRAAAQPAGVVPLRPGAGDPDHPPGQLGGDHRREAALRGERRVVRGPRHPAQGRRLLQDRRRLLRGHHRRQPPRLRRRRLPADVGHGRQLQGLRRGRVRERRGRGAVVAHRRIRLLGRRDGWREMVVGKQAGLQPEGRRFAVHCSGVPQIVDGDLHAPGQRGHVERPVGELGQAVPGAAVLPPRLDAVHVVARRVPHPQERAPVRPGGRTPDQAAVRVTLPPDHSQLLS
ncbi:SKU5 similar 4 [Zea mays]|uniref:SKU5 similar 4 n=1 Tax=Zea mays TaxID=4577 RepID=C0P3Q0_MAIZE|nr:unknown [Zea mays]ONM57618.1 SKU5 similar 4 [Zea mays]